MKSKPSCLADRSGHVAHYHLNLTKEFPEGIYDIGDLEIARCDLVKHRREQEKVIAANETNLHRAFSRQQFLKMNGGINPTETAAQNDDSLFARPASYPSDHRVLSFSGVAGEKPSRTV